MNVLTRGVKNALRSPVRGGAIILMLAISVALVLVMLSARTGVINKIDDVKAATASTISVSAAGIQGGQGGGDPLTADQVASITKTAHVTNVVSSLTDQLGTSDTNLTPSATLGKFGQRMQRFEGSSSSSMSSGESRDSGSETETRTPPQPRTTVTGTTDPILSQQMEEHWILQTARISMEHLAKNTALVGSNLASKNNLKAGSTLTAYG